MADSPNFWAVYERLVADEELSPRAAALVEAAMEGDPEVSRALSTPATDRPPRRSRPAAHAARAPRAFLGRIEVLGFRGVGASSTLELAPGPGLTLVVGRNGSGKSSFVEGVELLLTGDSTRWTGKKPVANWRSGWKNLHATGPVALSARLTVEGFKEPVTVDRRWGADDRLEAGVLAVRSGTERIAGGLDALGWSEALRAHRPFLSYNDVSRAWDAGPSKLFDALMGMLGMEDVRAALDRLAAVRKGMEKRRKDSSDARKVLVDALAGSSDPRAAACREVLSATAPDLGALEVALGERDEGEAEGALAALRRLAALQAPDEQAVGGAIRRVRDARAAEQQAASDRDREDLATAELLEHALRWHGDVGGEDCPVCGTGGVLDLAWQARAA